MKTENISEQLQKTGLSKNEANAYILLFKLVIIIESKEIYDAFVVMFELAFEQAKKYNK